MIALLLVLAAQDRGEYRAIFDERHPLSTIKEFTRRVSNTTLEFVKQNDRAGGEYDLAKENFEVYVPPSYLTGVPFGLFVWINSGALGAPPKEWLPVLDRHGLLWVAPNNCGNERPVWYRTNLSLDAVQNMKKRFTIDPERVYVSGLSGGGRATSRTALLYPDVFSGGFFMIGAEYGRNIPGKNPGYQFVANFPMPPRTLLDKARTQHRYVILTGENDHLHDHCQAVHQAYKADKFASATFLDVPGMGHVAPDAAWFEKGLLALDEPLFKRKRTPADEEAAAKALEAARAAKSQGALRFIATRWPGTKAAGEARRP